MTKTIVDIKIVCDPQGKDDPKPYVASVMGDGFDYHAKAASPSEALLLVSAHWHSRAHMTARRT